MMQLKYLRSIGMPHVGCLQQHGSLSWKISPREYIKIAPRSVVHQWGQILSNTLKRAKPLPY